jgi:UDP-glucuronate decarboxylase
MMMLSSPAAGSSELTYRGGHDGARPAASDEAAAGYSSPPSAKPPPQPHGGKPWLARPLRYAVAEQRLAFALLGMALASLVFLLAPPSSGGGSAGSGSASSGGISSRTTSSVAHLAAVGLAARQYTISSISSSSSRVPALFEQQQRQQDRRRRGVAGRVPLGLKRKGLRVVVTGGAGFVGSHLVDRLLARGDSVIVVDNLFTGRKENVLHHAGHPRFEMIRHDVVEPILLEVDRIYHLACPASPVHYKHNPVKTIKTNVVGTLNMLGLAKRVGARFLLTSTSEVYGDPLQHPQVETYWGNVNPIGMLCMLACVRLDFFF